MKRTSPLQKYATQFGYEHKNMNNHFSGIRKHANELSKLLDNMFPKDKKDKEKSGGKTVFLCKHSRTVDRPRNF